MKIDYKDRILSIIENLLKVKSIISIVVVITFAYLSATHFFDKQDVLQIIMIVITFYFGTQNGKISILNEYEKITTEKTETKDDKTESKTNS